jgi:hypothetical protein
MANKIDDILSRLDEMSSGRGTWESHWQEIADYIVPNRGNVTTSRTPGGKLHRNIYDGTALRALGILAAGLHGQLTSPSAPWFKVRSGNKELMKDQSVKVWWADTQRRMYDVMNASNFNSQIHEAYNDLGGFGTSVLYSEPDPKKLIRFDTRPVAECLIAENERGEIDTLFRRFTMTARQANQRWGDGKGDLSSSIKKKVEKKEYNATFELLHAVYPREDYDMKKADSRNMPWASVYVELREKHLISESGYHDFPYAVARWEKASDEIYGRSPSMKALPDVKMVNAMEKTLLRATQKIVDPPLLVPHDGYIMPIRMSPASLIMKRPGTAPTDKLEPLETKGNIPVGREMIDQKREAINQAFFVDLFLMLAEKPGMTATEILERVEEKMVVLGPALGRLMSEMLDPIIHRVFGILVRTGKLLPLPEALQGEEYVIEYVSPLARAQRLYEVNAINKSLQFVGPIAQVRPEVLDKYDFDKIVDYVNDILGVPADLMRGEDEVSEIRAARNEQTEAMNQIEAAKGIAEAAGKAGPIIQQMAGATGATA